MNKLKPLLFAIYFIIISTLPGCASIADDRRNKIYANMQSCITEERHPYLSSVKQDLSYIALPALLFSNKCNEYIANNCKNTKSIWIIAAPLALVDIPLAAVKDLYKSPKDYRVFKNYKECIK